MNDAQLEKLSMKIDNMLIKYAKHYNCSALTISAIAMARMVLLCDSVGSGEDFQKLCSEVVLTSLPEPKEFVH